jgi:hypothetical protein
LKQGEFPFLKSEGTAEELVDKVKDAVHKDGHTRDRPSAPAPTIEGSQ